MLKARVYHGKEQPRSLDELKERIATECDHVSTAEVKYALSNLHTRLELVVELQGNHFEQFIK
jgi:hypothetical protein